MVLCADNALFQRSRSENADILENMCRQCFVILAEGPICDWIYLMRFRRCSTFCLGLFGALLLEGCGNSARGQAILSYDLICNACCAGNHYASDVVTEDDNLEHCLSQHEEHKLVIPVVLEDLIAWAHAALHRQAIQMDERHRPSHVARALPGIQPSQREPCRRICRQ